METNSKLLAVFDRMVLEGNATWWNMFLPSGKVIFGTTKAAMLGYDDADFETYEDFTRLVHEDDYERVMQNMRDHLEGKRDVYEVQYRIKTKDGDFITFFDYGKIVKKEGEEISLIGLVFRIDSADDLENIQELLTSAGEDLPGLLARAGQEKVKSIVGF